MNRVLRIIKCSKWPDGLNIPLIDMESLPGDCIGDLKTDKNQLSFWRANNDDEILDALVYYVGLSNHTPSSNIEYIVFPKDFLESNDFKFQSTSRDLHQLYDEKYAIHLNMCDISYSKLGKLASIIANITVNENYNGCYLGTISKKEIERHISNILRKNPEYKDNLGKYYLGQFFSDENKK